MTPDEERQVLKDLVESDGWKLYMDQMSKAWGAEAFESRLSEELENAIAEERPALSSTMLATFKGVRASLRWPEERLRQIRDGVQPQARGALNQMHAAFQRVRREAH